MFFSSKCLMRQLLQTVAIRCVSHVDVSIRSQGLTCVQTLGHCRGIDQVALTDLAADVRVQGLEFDLPLHRVDHVEKRDERHGSDMRVEWK